MIESLHQILVSSSILRLFLVISLGYLVGQIRIWGISLNVAAILFVGIGFGMWDAVGFALPEEITVLGLVFFVYSIGIQSGPAFFSLFRERGLAYSGLALAALGTAFTLAWQVGGWLGLSPELRAGTFAGALTNTAALAAVTETVYETSRNAGVDGAAAMMKAGGPTMAYSVAYPFGVLGAILAMRILAFLVRGNLLAEQQAEQQGRKQSQALETREFRVEQAGLDGKCFADLHLQEKTGMIFTRMKHHEFASLISDGSVLHVGDHVYGVGTAAAVEKARELVGREVTPGLSVASRIEHRDVVMTNRRHSGKSLGELREEIGGGVLFSRLKRGFTPLPLDAHVRIQYGDKLRVVSYSENLEEVCGKLGDQIKDLAEGDFLSIALGIILGILVGMIPVPFPSGTSVKLGFAGGPLLVALLLGRLGRTGPIIWTLPTNTGLTIRQLGIYLFMAGIGIRAGGKFWVVLQQDGWKLFLLGAVVTAATALVILVLGRRWLKMDVIPLLGISAGIHGQPACLAYAENLTGSQAPSILYATVQPVSMLLKIVLGQLLVLLA